MSAKTIAAISTALSNSGIGIVRMSGEKAFDIADQIFRAKNPKKKLKDQKSHTIHYGFIYDGDQIIDEVLVSLFRGPNSYTAEDTVEINCHGGIFPLKKVLETVIEHGAQPAEPGEFTKRAFLNGRIDLSQAEAVMDVITSKNDLALKNSLTQLRGSVHDKIKEVRQQILYEVAAIESALDDPEHISLDGYAETLKEKNQQWMNAIGKLIDSSDNGKLLKEGIQTVIVGKPNAGKSSILNLLVGEEKAIVTDIEGTTRDALEETININGILLNIVDTAGIRETENVVEKIGVDRAKKWIETADLVLYVVDTSRKLDENDEQILQMIQEKKTIILLNKSDLKSEVTKSELEEKWNHKMIDFSAKEHRGIDHLEDTLKEMFFNGLLVYNDEIVITNIRQKKMLINAKESLRLVENSIEIQMPEDFFSIDLMNAYELLGKITGDTVEEDLVNEIFSKFCMGK